MTIYSGFTHWKWWFSIVFCMFTRPGNFAVNLWPWNGAEKMLGLQWSPVAGPASICWRLSWLWPSRSWALLWGVLNFRKPVAWMHLRHGTLQACCDIWLYGYVYIRNTHIHTHVHVLCINMYIYICVCIMSVVTWVVDQALASWGLHRCQYLPWPTWTHLVITRWDNHRKPWFDPNKI